MNIFEKLAENPELQFWTVAGIVAVCMALGAFVTYIFGVLPLKGQNRQRGRTGALCDNGRPAEYYENAIADLKSEVEFWQGNCKTAEDRYNKLYQEVYMYNGSQDQ